MVKEQLLRTTSTPIRLIIIKLLFVSKWKVEFFHNILHLYHYYLQYLEHLGKNCYFDWICITSSLWLLRSVNDLGMVFWIVVIIRYRKASKEMRNITCTVIHDSDIWCQYLLSEVDYIDFKASEINIQCMSRCRIIWMTRGCGHLHNNRHMIWMFCWNTSQFTYHSWSKNIVFGLFGL